MRKLAITKEAYKALTSLPAKQYKQLASTIFKLLIDPTPHDSMELKGATHGERRVDIGEYRIIYTFTSEAVEVLLVGKRNDDQIYRLWNRRK